MAGLLASAIMGVGQMAWAQAGAAGQPGSSGRPEDKPGSEAKAAEKQAKGEKTTKVGADAPAAPKAPPQARRAAPSAEYEVSIRKTVERRRQRRARRAQGQISDSPQPAGAIVPWPMPPALIIRQTSEVHDEIDSLLGALRRSG